MNTTLNPVQASAVDAVVRAIEAEKRRVLFVMASGTGKMPVISRLVELLGSSRSGGRPVRFLFLSDRQDVSLMARTHFQFEGIRASSNEDDSATVTIITLQKIAQQSFDASVDPNDYNYIIVFGTEWQAIDNPDSNLRNFLSTYSRGVIIGVDSVLDKSSLFFGEPVFHFSIQDAIKQSVLVGYHLFNIEISEESAVSRLKVIARELVKLSNNTKTILYCKDQSEANALSQMMNEFAQDEDYSSAIIADKGISHRNVTIDRFRKTTSPMILTTVDVLSGIDLPNVMNIGLARIIQSERYLKQIIGKGLLPNPTKTALSVFDFSGGANHLKDIPPLSKQTIKARALSPAEKDDFSFQGNFLLKDKHQVEGVLGVKDLAFELATIVINFPVEPGHMVGIFGKWGRGKTFLMNELWRFLKIDNFKKVSFHAWKYQDTPAVWAYLFEQFSKEYFASAGNFWSRIWRRFRLNAQRLGLRPLLWFFTLFMVFTASYFLFDLRQKIDFLTTLLRGVGGSVLVYVILVYYKYSETARDLYSRYLGRRAFSHLLGIQAEVQKELKYLLNTWVKLEPNLRIVLFVDDIDRCSEKKIIEVIDALRVMMDDEEISSHLVVITAIDERILKRAIKLKYSEIVGNEPKDVESTYFELEQLTREYIDKLFILGIKLGDLSVDERIAFFTEFTKDDFERKREQSARVDSMDAEISARSDSAIKRNGPIRFESKADQSPQDLDPQSSVPGTSNAGYKLPSREFVFLTDCLSNSQITTPRQIRIFYYRYLMLKGILARVYSQSPSNYWSESDNIKTLIDLLSKYSFSRNMNQFEVHKKNLLESRDQMVKIYLSDSSMAPKEDYQKLIEALEMVVAY